MSPLVSGGRTASRLFTPSKLVLVAGMATAPGLVWTGPAEDGPLLFELLGRSARYPWLPLLFGPTWPSCSSRRGADRSFFSDLMTIGPPGAAAAAGRLERVWPPRTSMARVALRIRDRTNCLTASQRPHPPPKGEGDMR